MFKYIIYIKYIVNMLYIYHKLVKNKKKKIFIENNIYIFILLIRLFEF